ncbi:MAG: DUF2846 domain-containing protein [Verrucomicrobia bacterium]|nr:DUF2846 domain-containing protein [Verrucomicrobiota bacterium]
MQSHRLLILTAILIGSTGCALKPPSWIGSRKPQPPPETALVYFFRPRSPVAAAVSADVQDNAINLGTLSDGTYFVYHAKPGPHSFMLITDSVANQPLRVRAGLTYYLRARIDQAGPHNPPHWATVSPVEAQAAIRHLERLNYGE